VTVIDSLANLFSTPGGRVERGVDDRAMELGARPARNTLSVVASATLLFWQAERGINPRVSGLVDALSYVTACLSVGHSLVQPVTPAGKLIGAALMTVGPSLSAAFLAGPAGRTRDQAVERAMLETLQEIRDELARRPGENTEKAGE
jgi:hypothetical protein